MKMNSEAKVGAMTLVGLVLLAYMIVHLGNFSFGERGYPISAVFSQVNGLKQGNLVRYAGVEIGKVKAVEVTPEGVQVELLVKAGVQIPTGSWFSIGTDGLLGEKFIEIVPPRSYTSFLEPNSIIRGQDPQGLDHLIASADKVLADIQALVRSLNDVIGDDKVKASLKATIHNTRDITDNLNRLSATLARMAENNEGDVNQMVSNLKDMSISLKSVASRADTMIAGIDNNGQTGRDLREAIANIRSTSVRVEKMAAALEGVVTDPQTSQDIRETLKNAREASAKANQMLTKFGSISTQTGVDVMYGTNNNQRYKINGDITVRTSPQDFAVVGVNSIGEGSRANLQIGKGNDDFAKRMGIVNGKAGIGVDGKLTDQMRLSLDVYDPNDVRVKLRTQYQIAADTFLVGETDSINKSADRNTYFGVRRTF